VKLFKEFKDVQIVSTGVCEPAEVVDNITLLAEIGLTDLTPDKVEDVYGVRERRRAGPRETCATLAARAAEQALATAGMVVAEVDLISVSATPGDAVTPPTSAIVHSLLEAQPGCVATDVERACVGWSASLENVLHQLKKGPETAALVLAGTVLSRGLHWPQPQYRLIFGDLGAGILLRKCDPGQGQLWYSQQWTFGEHYDKIFFSMPWSVAPLTVPEESRGGFYMSERGVFFEQMADKLGPCFEEFWFNSGLKPDDIAIALMHQPSKPLFLEGVRRSGIPLDKVHQNLAHYGNVIAAELPLGLHELFLAGRIQPGDWVLMFTYGAGFTVGITAFQY